MTRRSTPSSKIDNNRFPIRVFLVVPGTGFGPLLNEMMKWLRERVPADGYALHGGGYILKSTGICDRSAIYFKRLEDLAAFFETFPQLELAIADDT